MIASFQSWLCLNSLQHTAAGKNRLCYAVVYTSRLLGRLSCSIGVTRITGPILCKHYLIAAASEQKCTEFVAVGVSVAIIGVCVGICGFLFTTIKALRSKRYGVMQALINHIQSSLAVVSLHYKSLVNHRTLQVTTQDNQAYGVKPNKKPANTKQSSNTTTQPDAEYEVISF